MLVRVKVLEVRHKAVNVVAKRDTSRPRRPFWLPRKPTVEWPDWLCPMNAGDWVCCDIPKWLVARHRQLIGDEEYETIKSLHADRHMYQREARTVRDGTGSKVEGKVT